MSILNVVQHKRPLKDRALANFFGRLLPLPLSLRAIVAIVVASILLVLFCLWLLISTGSDLAASAALAIAVLPLACASVPLAVWDFRYRLLPNRIVLPLFVPALLGLTVASSLSGDFLRLGRSLLLALAVAVFFFLVMMLPGQHIGGGDFKLLVLLVLVFSWFSPLLALGGFIFATSLGALWAVLILLRRSRASVPFGPALLLGYLLSAVVVLN